MNSECLQRRIVIAVYGGVNRQLLIGLYNLQQASDFRRNIAVTNRVSALTVNDAVPFDRRIVRKILNSAVIKAVDNLNISLVVVYGIDKLTGCV